MGVVLSTGATSVPAIDGAIGDASVNASWFDTLTFKGPIQGETVQYLLTATVAGSMTCGGETSGSASFQISWGQATTLYFSDDNCSGKLAGKQSAIATFEVGQSQTIGGQLLSSVRAIAGNGCCGSYTLVSENDLNAGDTFALTITPITPGASYISASGTNYSVPEPSSFLLLAVGLAFVFVVTPISRRLSPAG
jgi:PEP-CTERM motif